MSIEALSLCPLFDDEVIALMRRVLPPARHDHVSTAAVFRATRP